MIDENDEFDKDDDEKWTLVMTDVNVVISQTWRDTIIIMFMQKPWRGRPLQTL